MGPAFDSHASLVDLFAATTSVSMIRAAAFDLLVGLAEVDLPALLLVEVIDAAFPNAIPLHKKWQVVTAVKHFHRRCCIAGATNTRVFSN